MKAAVGDSALMTWLGFFAIIAIPIASEKYEDEIIYDYTLPSK
jgi:hypothetical protein